MSTLPFDSQGTALTNLIPNEKHVVNQINGVDHNYIIPLQAPFFNDSLRVVVVDPETNEVQPLTLNEDYYFAFPVEELSDTIDKDLSGGLVFKDPNFNNTVYLSYQSIGEPFANPERAIIANGLDTLQNLLYPDWSTVDPDSVPEKLPPTFHIEELNNFEGVDAIISQLGKIVEAMYQNPRKILMSDIADIDEGYINPLMEKLAGITASIENLSIVSAIRYYTNDTTALDENDVISLPDANKWYPIGLSIEVPQDGNYQINLDGNPAAFGDNIPEERKKCILRWLKNGVPMKVSRFSGAIRTLKEGDVISVQVMANSEAAPDMIAINGDIYGSVLTLTNLGV